MFSERSRGNYTETELARAIGDALRGRASILDLTASNPTRAELPYADAEIISALADPRALSYAPEPFGDRRARDAIAEEWRERAPSISADRIVLTASTSEAYGVLFKLLCDPGDEVLVPEPSYPLLAQLAQFEATRLSPYRLAYDGAWHIDFASLERARSERSRALVVVHPNNPTGSFLSRDELDTLSKFGLPIVSDEVFASYPLRENALRAKSAIGAAHSTLVFVLDGLSKLAALPQLKLAWTIVAGPEPMVAEALGRLEILLDAYLSPGTPVQLALPRLLATRHTATNAIKQRLGDNLAFLRKTAAGSALTVLDAEGGWYAVLHLPRGISEEDWVLGLLESHEVLVQPGFFYDFAQEPLLVVSLLTPEATFREGVRRIVRAVADAG